MKGITYESIYKAHLRLVHSDEADLRCTDIIDNDLAKYALKVLRLFEYRQVSVDSEFRGNARTEIGLTGNSPGSVQEAAEMIMKYVEEHKPFQPIGD